jgi:cyclophilin family peptidyl-prolyl cis-trans isomerase
MIRAIFAVMLTMSFTFPAVAQESPVELKTDQEKISYVFGISVGTSLKKQGIDPDMDALAQGIQDVMAGGEVRFTTEEQQQIVQKFQAEQNKKAAIASLGEDAWKIQLEKPQMMAFDKDKTYYWVLSTNKGTIKIKLMPDVAPMHVTSTIYLTQKGFYDGLTFHRIIPGFMAQGGCPYGNGTGGPGYQYDGEFSSDVKHDMPYMLSMANAGSGTDGSQFFITFASASHLDGKHTIFGRVVDGKDVVKKIETYGSSDGTPKETITIEHAAIEEE